MGARSSLQGWLSLRQRQQPRTLSIPLLALGRRRSGGVGSYAGSKFLGKARQTKAKWASKVNFQINNQD